MFEMKTITAFDLNAVVPKRAFKIPGHYWDSGAPRNAPDAPAIIMMPGVGLPMKLMLESAKHLHHQGSRVIVIETPGFGATELPLQVYPQHKYTPDKDAGVSSLQPYVDHSGAILQHLKAKEGVEISAIVAHSMQGYVQFERLRQMGLGAQEKGTDSVPSHNDPVFGDLDGECSILIAANTCTTADSGAKQNSRTNEAIQLREAASKKDEIYRGFLKGLNLQEPNSLWDVLQENDPEAFAEAWIRIAYRQDTTDAVAAYPKLAILVGERDKDPQRDGVDLLKTTRAALGMSPPEVVDLPGVGHVPFHDVPKQFAEGVLMACDHLGGATRPKQLHQAPPISGVSTQPPPLRGLGLPGSNSIGGSGNGMNPPLRY